MNALRIWRRVPSRQYPAAAITLAIAILLAINVTPTSAAEFQPEDFDVNIEMGPEPGASEQRQPTCTVNPDLTQTCGDQMDYVANDRVSTGTVAHRTSGLRGTIETVCDMEMHNSFKFLMTPPTTPGEMPRMDVLEVSGSMRNLCGWHMSFDDGSALTGRIAGSMTMNLIDAATGTVRMEAAFNVDVVHGGGRFADTVGSGSFGHSEEFSVFGQGGPGAGPGDGPGGPGDGPGGRSLSLRSASTPVRSSAESGMNLKLRKGASRVRIVAPTARLDRGAKAVLRAVAAPKAKCKARATSGAKSVSLGSARAKTNGNVVFRGAVGAKLKSGKWSINVRCRSGRTTASDRGTVTVK